MPKYKYSDQQKAEILLFFNNHTIKETIQLYGVGYTSLMSWKNPEFHKNQKELLKKDYIIHKNERIQYQKEYYEKLKGLNIKSSILDKNVLSYAYCDIECQKEYQKIINLPGEYKSASYLNKIILTYQPHFYEIEKKLWKDNKDDLRQWLIDNRKKYIKKDEFKLTDKEILRGMKISGVHIGFSHFNPLIIKKFITDYTIKSIYDPFAGWGHRLLGANNIRYIGNDLDERTYNGLCKISKDFNMGLTTEKEKIFYNMDSTSFTPQEDYEAVFTCPPYYNIEIYQNNPFKNIQDYYEFWNKSVNNSLKSSVKTFAYVINGEFKEKTHQICLNNGLIFLNEHPLSLRYNHFQRQLNTQKTKSEYLMIYKKLPK
jgi:hypothetical protein